MTSPASMTTPPTLPLSHPQAPSTPGGAEWASTDSVESLAMKLRGARSAMVVTHAKPDGDAIGSTLAITRAMLAAGVDARIVYVGPVPEWANQLIAKTPFQAFAPGTSVVASAIEHALASDIAVIVDTGSWTQLAEMRPVLEPRWASSMVIDHHLQGDAKVAGTKLISTSSASCTQVLAPVCAALLGCATAADLPIEVAEPLYLGLATDTGWLRYSSVTPTTLRLAADLLQAGVDHTRLYRMIEQQDTPARWTLFGRALTSLELHAWRGEPSKIATMMLTNRDFAETHASRDHTNGYADMLLTVASVELSVVFSEQSMPDGSVVTKLSLRSKPGPSAIDVNALAQKLGGGGHARAAGAKINLPIDAAKSRFLQELG